MARYGVDSGFRSRAAVLAVVLFLFFDFTALALNVWLSWKIEKQAIAINLAGRQRMLSQRMAKVLLLLDEQSAKARMPARSGADSRPLLDELRLTFELFDTTLEGFANGQVTRGGADETLYLDAVTGSQARQLVSDAGALWHPYRSLVLAVIDASPENLAEVLPPAVSYAKQHNLALLGLMNKLTTELEILTQREAARIRLYQGIAFLLALVNFCGAFVLYGRRIREGDKQKNLLDEIINKVSASVLVLDADETTILKANRTSEVLFAYAPGELIGHQLSDLLERRDGTLVGLKKDGATFIAVTESNPAVLDGKHLFIQTISDITEQRMTEVHLSSLAYHDLLTKLPNRLLFDDRLRMEIAHAQRRNLKLGILFIDLDNFKPINDIHGHYLGDLLLQDVAVRMKRCLRESDTISRRGGDEFTVIINDIGDREHCAKVAQVIISQLEKAFVIDDKVFLISASVGIAIFPDDGDDAHLLVSHADEAMYRAKQDGRGIYRYYSAPLARPNAT